MNSGEGAVRAGARVRSGKGSHATCPTGAFSAAAAAATTAAEDRELCCSGREEWSEGEHVRCQKTKVLFEIGHEARTKRIRGVDARVLDLSCLGCPHDGEDTTGKAQSSRCVIWPRGITLTSDIPDRD